MAPISFFEKFVSEHPVFTRQRFRADFVTHHGDHDGKTRDDLVKAADDVIEYQSRVGRILPCGSSVYAAVPAHLIGSDFTPDRYLVAALAREDGILAYHSALELHGLAYSDSNEVQVLSSARPGLLETRAGNVRFVKVPVLERESGTMDGVTTFDRTGIHVRVTTLERTVLDCLERPDLAGGVEELEHALSGITSIKLRPLLAMVERRENHTLAGLVGWWLESRQDDLGLRRESVDQALARLDQLAPSKPRPYAGAERTEDTLVKRWGLWLPPGLTDPAFEDNSDRMGF